MVLLLIEFLRTTLGIKVPAVFGYYSTRMLLAAATSLMLCVFLGPRLIRWLYSMKIGQPIRKDHVPLLAELHEKKENTPTMGGLLILASLVLSLLIWMDLTHAFTLILLLTTLWLGGIGAYDDLLKLKFRNSKGLPGRWKLVLQGGFALLLAGYLLVPGWAEKVHQGRWFPPPTAKEEVQNGGEARELSSDAFNRRLYIPFVKGPWVVPAVLIGILTLFVVVGSSNAVNLTDGLDGLAAGCLVMVAMTLSIIAFLSNHLVISQYLNILYIDGAGEIAIYLCAFTGACLGFLWYNGHPAQVFMGDTGSLALGGVLGVCAVLLRRELLLAIVGGIFVAEALSVIIQVGSVQLRGQRVFLCAPLHHHFEYKGWPESKVVIRFWIVGLLLALIGLGSLKFQ